MAFSGINGSNCLLSSMAANRVKEGMIDQAQIKGQKGNYIVSFLGPSASWKGDEMVLCSARKPYEARIFKSLDGAMSAIQNIGLMSAVIKTL